MRKGRFLATSLVLTVALILLLSNGSMYSAESFKVRQFDFETSRIEYVPDEIIVKFKEGTSLADIERIHVNLGAAEMPDGQPSRFTRVKIPLTSSVKEMVEFYKARPEVEYAEPNYIYHAFMTPNDPYYSYQWHLPKINAGPAWDLSTGSGVLVGIIDTGVAYENYGSYAQAPDLAGTNFVAGYDFVNSDAHANDDEAHGTHVAGTVAQTTNNGLGVAGVAFNCTIMPIKVLNSSGSGTITAIANGIYYAADHGCKVINMSLGGPTGSTTLQNACIYAYNAGVTIVCAAGNAGTSTPQYPAAYTQCISVSATRYDDTKPSYSSYGSTIDICAPGGDLGVDQNGDGYGDGVLQMTFTKPNYTTFGYYFYDGTSMASPHVTGVAAMVIAAAGGSLTPAQVRDYLQSTATDLGSAGWDQYYGYGKVNAYAAVVAAQGGGGQPPVANFSGTPTSGTAPLTVQFTDLSSNSPTSWSWNFGDGGGSTVKNPSHQYTSAGNYTVSLTATNAYGSDTETKTNYITVTSGGGWTVITYDDFESSMGSYTDGGGDCSRYTRTTYAHQGRAAVDIQDNSGTASSFYHTASYNVSGYNTLEVEFWFRFVSMESGEDFWVQYYDGSTWRTVATFARGTTYANNVFYNPVVTISSGTYNFPTNAKIRFMCDASDNNDDVYIDEVEFRGTTAVGAGSFVEKPPVEPGRDIVEETPQAVFGVKNYPNPFNPVTTIKFGLERDGYTRLDVYDVSGRLVTTLVNGTMPAGTHEVTWNAAGVASGVYFSRLTQGQRSVLNKMVLLR